MTPDVCVVGAGPAGAACAARLAALGLDVLVLERERFPRPHVGESLSPAAWPLLEQLGVHERVAAAGFVRVAEARVRWRGAEERVPLGDGLTVDRGAFDALLLDAARAAGAVVREAAVVRGGLPPARFVVDATGRRRLLGGRRRPVGARTLALHAEWGDGPAEDGAQTRIAAVRDGWLWGARLPGGRFRAMSFTDPPAVARAGHDAGRLFAQLLGESPLFAELPPPARVQACDASCYSTPAPVDGGSVRVGEAAFAIDPLSSCGVQTALATGLAAAATVHTLLTPGLDDAAARDYYAEHVRHAVARHSATAAALYAEHGEHADAPFWRARAAAPPEPSAVAQVAPLADLLARPVRLAPDAALVPTPCLVDDRVERRRALAHPALDRPVAFLGGHELAPLLDGLAVAPTLAHALEAWRLPAPSALELAAWLHGRGLISARAAP